MSQQEHLAAELTKIIDLLSNYVTQTPGRVVRKLLPKTMSLVLVN